MSKDAFFKNWENIKSAQPALYSWIQYQSLLAFRNYSFLNLLSIYSIASDNSHVSALDALSCCEPGSDGFQHASTTNRPERYSRSTKDRCYQPSNQFDHLPYVYTDCSPTASWNFLTSNSRHSGRFAWRQNSFVQRLPSRRRRSTRSSECSRHQRSEPW